MTRSRSQRARRAEGQGGCAGVPAARPRVARPPHVLLVCSGLDHARRGFESFARECFDVLRGEADLRIELVKGSGASGPGERAIPSLRRDRAVARTLSRIRGTRAFRFEHAAFALSLQPLLLRRRPDLVYLSEWDTARVLAALRTPTNQRFKLLLCNGAMAADGFQHLDCVQELTPAGRDYVLARGADPRRHTVLPLGFRIAHQFQVQSQAERSALRERLQLPVNQRIVLSMAALNRSHKRLHYLIEEVARLPEPRPFLLLAGDTDTETPAIRELALRHLGAAGHSIRTVPYQEVPDLYRASDVFVLASLAEAQGRAFVEALAHGLPCLAHDYPIAHFALGEHGRFGDLTQPAALTSLLLEHSTTDAKEARARHRFAYENFSWDRLRSRYVDLLTLVAQGDHPLPQPLVAKSTVSSSTGEKLSTKKR